MIYVQLRARVKLAQGETLHVADAAKVLGSEKAGHCSLFCPTSPGVYTLDAIAVAKALKKVFPQEDISLIGADVCYVHRIKARGKDFLRPVRTAAALLILLRWTLGLPGVFGVVAMVVGGMFVGMVASALGEILEVAPVLMRRFRLGDVSGAVRVTILLAKTLGAIIASIAITL